MDLELSGYSAIVTGGASGIGLATVKLLLSECCQVTIWDLAPDLPEVVANLTAEFPSVKCRGMSCNIADLDSVQSAMTQTQLADMPLQILVHAAAIGSGKFGFPFSNLGPGDWQRVVQVNICGTANVAHTVIPHLEPQRGSVVLVASVAGQIGSQTDPPYSASKAANINFGQCMAKDLAGQGIRVNTVCPGMVQTPLNRAVWESWARQQSVENWRSYEDWADEKVRKVVPLGRWQTCEDVAEMIVFLCSRRARQVTGQTVNVDGGFVMHW